MTPISSLSFRTCITLLVTLAINSASNGPLLARSSEFANCIASAGRCTVSSVIGSAMTCASLGAILCTRAYTMGGFSCESDSYNSSVIAVRTGSVWVLSYETVRSGLSTDRWSASAMYQRLDWKSQRWIQVLIILCPLPRSLSSFQVSGIKSRWLFAVEGEGVTIGFGGIGS
jgi:hypothetical protein